MQQRTCERCGRENPRPRAAICWRCKKTLDNAKARGTQPLPPMDAFDCAWCGKHRVRGVDVEPHASRFCDTICKRKWHSRHEDGATRRWRERHASLHPHVPRRVHDQPQPAPDPLSAPRAWHDKAYGDALVHDPCAYCGGKASGPDHITPTVAGGLDEWTNLAGACHRCNARKSATPLLLFLGWDRAKREFEPWRAAVSSYYRAAA